MTRYRKTPSQSGAQDPLKPSDLPEPSLDITISPKGSKGSKSFLWMPDKEGNLVKAEASTVKKSFAKLSAQAQVALTEYLIRYQNRVPTESARKTVFNSIVDGAVAAYKEGKKQTPWDILAIQMKNAPSIANQSINIVQYDRVTSDALLNQIADSIGFDTDLITEEDRTAFLNDINAAAQAGGKEVKRQVTGGGIETITTPAVFNAKDFANNFLWAKVNIGEPSSLPTKVIEQMSTIRKAIEDNGLQLSDPEVRKISLDVASGKKSTADIQKEFSTMAAKIYPQLAERLNATPGLTVRQAVSPILNTIAKTWEMDVNTLDLNDPMVDQLIRPDGVLGKQAPKTNYDAYMFAVNHPNYEKTEDAINKARQAALGLASAMGWGV